MECQRCFKCDEPTGRADVMTSLYDDDGDGPYCEECYAALAALEDENDG